MGSIESVETKFEKLLETEGAAKIVANSSTLSEPSLDPPPAAAIAPTEITAAAIAPSGIACAHNASQRLRGDDTAYVQTEPIFAAQDVFNHARDVYTLDHAPLLAHGHGELGAADNACTAEAGATE